MGHPLDAVTGWIQMQKRSARDTRYRARSSRNLPKPMANGPHSGNVHFRERCVCADTVLNLYFRGHDSWKPSSSSSVGGLPSAASGFDLTVGQHHRD
ncbi:hypothetical protein AND_000490 [Anopheles darlingi]|uniref:Uncharacterized protein n=1 Tax=Anopheles darlingi TaxID=43151 RepID=W5JUA3_ANODA|nr:hypothetical protein AND_000490 [Anopheles darlingi]